MAKKKKSKAKKAAKPAMKACSTQKCDTGCTALLGLVMLVFGILMLVSTSTRLQWFNLENVAAVLLILFAVKMFSKTQK